MQPVSAPVDTSRRAMGHLLGHAVRFGPAGDVMAAGEGIETMLSLRCVMPSLTMVAALSAAGLFDRAQSAGMEAMVMSPQCEDFNEDLRNFDISALRAALRIQLTLEDVGRFLITGI